VTSPATLAVRGANRRTVAFVRDHPHVRDVAEIGVYRCDTARELLPIVRERGGTLHLFDYEDVLLTARAELGGKNVEYHPNSRRSMDSYCWSLARLVARKRSWSPDLLDYAYIDGAHVFAIDALAFVLVDRLLRPGGFVDFDDYRWTIRSSPTHNPLVFPEITHQYTWEQRRVRQVRMVVELLVRPHPGYDEVVRNKVFQKAW